MPRTTLQNIAWETYKNLSDASESGLRLSYDRGCLELEMSPLPKHEGTKRLLETLFEVWCEEREIPFLPLGSVTYRREGLRQGAEPDSSFRLTEPDQAMDFDALSGERIAPDLVIEIDLESPSVSKNGFYALIGVREIWRWHDDAVTILCRRGELFEPCEASELIPGVLAERLTELLALGKTTPMLRWRSAARAWARDRS